MARIYTHITTDTRKKVFIRVHSKHAALSRHLKDRVAKDAEMRHRVAVGSEEEGAGDEWASRDLILVDEALSFEGIYAKLCSDQSVMLFSSHNEFTTDSVSKVFSEKGFDFESHALSVSLRATQKLTDFVAGFEAVRKAKWRPVISGVAIKGSDPEILRITKPWNGDQKFLNMAVERLIGNGEPIQDRISTVPSFHLHHSHTQTMLP